jgi:hypothetical protein
MGRVMGPVRVRRKIVEDKLLVGIRNELFTPEAIKAFRQDLAQLMAERRRKAKPELEAPPKEAGADGEGNCQHRGGNQVRHPDKDDQG